MPEPAAAWATYGHSAPAQIACSTLIPANTGRYLQWNKLIQAYFRALMAIQVYVITDNHQLCSRTVESG